MKHDDWSPYLKMIAFAYNTTPNRTSCAPSELVFGFNPTSLIRFDPREYCRETPQAYVNWIARRVAIVKNRAVKRQKQYDAVRKRGYDKRIAGGSATR